jgi:hypothetical protein
VFAWASVQQCTLSLSLPRLLSVEAVLVSVTPSEEAGVVVLGFVHEDGVSRELLIFQLSGTLDQQDGLLGMDTYSISGEGGATYYGGVLSATFAGTVLQLQLTHEAAQALGCTDELALQLQDEAAVQMVRDGLRRLGISAAGV